MENNKKTIFFILLILLLIFFSVYLIFSKKLLFNNSKKTLDTDVPQESHISNAEKKQDFSNHFTSKKFTTATTEKQSSDIFGMYYDKAEVLLESMSLEEKVGQIFLARYPGTNKAINEIQSENPGGYILFKKDFANKTKENLKTELANNQSHSKIDLLLAVDEEGGTVTRVSSNTNFRKSKFKSPQDLFKIGGMQSILDDSKEKSALLKSLGLNMNLAPVVDVSTDPSSFIYKRTYGKNSQETSIYSSELIKTMNSDKMISSMKHFPGYGDNVDTHTGIAIDKRDYSIFETSDFLPFKSGIDAGAPTILVNHNIVNCMDSNKPASLSENVHKILRDDLGFSGLIITDDLAMDAVKTSVENGEAAVQAVLAGNDLIISSSFVEQKQEVLNAIQNGIISEDIINTAVRRILACKYYYGIIE